MTHRLHLVTVAVALCVLAQSACSRLPLPVASGFEDTRLDDLPCVPLVLTPADTTLRQLAGLLRPDLPRPGTVVLTEASLPDILTEPTALLDLSSYVYIIALDAPRTATGYTVEINAVCLETDAETAHINVVYHAPDGPASSAEDNPMTMIRLSRRDWPDGWQVTIHEHTVTPEPEAMP